MFRRFQSIFQRQPGVGIDFGTYKSAIARKDSAEEPVKIVPTIYHNEHQLKGENYIPTRACLRINKKGELEIHPATWYEKDEIRTYYIRWFKLRLGNGWKKIKHGIHELEDIRGEIRDKLGVSSEKFSVEGISGYFLNQLIKSLNDRYSGKTAISVPAGWTYSQRRAALYASEIGFVSNPILVDEPVAAAIHLLHNSNKAIPKNENFLIIDIGAGTTDIALLFFDGKNLLVKDVESYPFGGIQIDREMYKQYEKSLDKELFAEYPPELHQEFLLEIIREWKEKYNDLVKNGNEDSGIFLNTILARRFLRKYEIQFSLPIKEFKTIGDGMAEQYSSYVLNFFEKIGAEAASINYISVVGGTSKFYCIEEATTRVFNSFTGREPVVEMETKEPEWCVTRGAAYYSWAVQNKNRFLKTSLEKSMGLTLPASVNLISGNLIHKADKNEPLPLPTGDVILDLQTRTPVESITIEIWQGIEDNIVDKITITAELGHETYSFPQGMFFQIAYRIDRDKLIHFYPPVYSNWSKIKLVLKHDVFSYIELGKGVSNEIVIQRSNHQL